MGAAPVILRSQGWTWLIPLTPLRIASLINYAAFLHHYGTLQNPSAPEMLPATKILVCKFRFYTCLTTFLPPTPSSLPVSLPFPRHHFVVTSLQRLLFQTDSQDALRLTRSSGADGQPDSGLLHA